MKDITKGKWKVGGDLDKLTVFTHEEGRDEFRICLVDNWEHMIPDYEQSKSNAQFIAEAGNVAQETGMSPREMQKKINTLETMREAINRTLKEFKGTNINDIAPKQFESLVLLEQSLASTKSKQS